MMVKHITGATRIIGKSQGYAGLPLRDVLINDQGRQTPAMVSAWEPTPDEIATIVAGGAIYLMVIGEAHPPVLLLTRDITAAPEGQP